MSKDDSPRKNDTSDFSHLIRRKSTCLTTAIGVAHSSDKKGTDGPSKQYILPSLIIMIILQYIFIHTINAYSHIAHMFEK